MAYSQREFLVQLDRLRACGISQLRLGLMLGCSAETVSRWGRKLNMPQPRFDRRLHQLIKILSVLWPQLTYHQVDQWLLTRNIDLRGKTPELALRLGEYSKVLKAAQVHIENLNAQKRPTN
jgi:hypothetical protein